MYSAPSKELGLEQPCLTQLQDSIPLPLFLTYDSHTKTEEDLLGEQYILANITLRTLLNRVHDSLPLHRRLSASCSINKTDIQGNLLNSERLDYRVPVSVIQELARQLQSWYDHLPLELRWSDTSTSLAPTNAAFPNFNMIYNIKELSTIQSTKMILKATLASRYKYAQHLIWRPYVYKALHAPESVTDEDLHGCQQSIEVSQLS